MAATFFPPPLDQRRRAIVLVHGAWVGEWSWAPVLEPLRASGRPVFAVSLTGHGTRRHENGPHITLADHVADVIGVLEVHDLVEVTLVGHSYGGRVITQVWGEAADRIGRMIYLDAHGPIGPDPGQSAERRAAAEANGGMVEFAAMYDPQPNEVGGPDGVAWFLERIMPQSFVTFDAPFQIPLPDDLPKTYVFATDNEPSRFAGYAAAAAADPAWEYLELPSSHWLMATHPAEVSTIILNSHHPGV